MISERILLIAVFNEHEHFLHTDGFKACYITVTIFKISHLFAESLFYLPYI